jgi:hypothetical protein
MQQAEAGVGAADVGEQAGGATHARQCAPSPAGAGRIGSDVATSPGFTTV